MRNGILGAWPPFSSYDHATGKPSVETNAQGFTTCRKYDEFGHIIAVYGTFATPACFAYDEDGNLIKQITFRVPGIVLTDDPSSRTDGDVTQWEYAWQAPLVLKKIFQNGQCKTAEYGAMNRLSFTTNARGKKTFFTYDTATSQIRNINYDDGMTPSISYSYNHLGWLKIIRAGGGERVITYDAYGNQDMEKWNIQPYSVSLQQKHDVFGREVGIQLKRNGSLNLFDSNQTYDSTGRIATGGLMVQGSNQVFSYSYLEGTQILKTITMPQGVIQIINYEEQRNLPTSHQYQSVNGSALALGDYDYDSQGCVLKQNWQRNGEPVVESLFSVDSRSQISTATCKGNNYSYAYDNIGNRTSILKRGTETSYNANEQNQYDQIQEETGAPFTPQYDMDGNQTKLKTSTGIWTVTYDTDNRPIRFTNPSSSTVVECTYDDIGRRIIKKVTIAGTTRTNERYFYHGYTQIVALNIMQSMSTLHTILWDPSSGMSKRPLALVRNNVLYTYAIDRAKNVREVIDRAGQSVASYDYDPFGNVSGSSSVKSPIQWSSEFFDEELGMVYYNYRHYNPFDGRWISRDPKGEEAGWNLYAFSGNRLLVDNLGLGRNGIDRAMCEPSNPLHKKAATSILDSIKKKCQEICGEEIGNKDIGSSIFSFLPDDIWIGEDEMSTVEAIEENILSGGEDPSKTGTETTLTTTLEGGATIPTGIGQEGKETGIETSGTTSYPNSEKTTSPVSVRKVVADDFSIKAKAIAKLFYPLPGTGITSTTTATATGTVDKNGKTTGSVEIKEELDVPLTDNLSLFGNGSYKNELNGNSSAEGQIGVKYKF